MDEAVRKKPGILSSYYVRIIGTLFAITAVVAILLSLVNMVTAPTIQQLAEEKRQQSMLAVMPDADFYSQLPYNGDDPLILDIQGAFKDNALAGYCVQVETNGFGGALQLMVGVDGAGAVTGVSILSHAETLNTSQHPWLIAQFAGRSGVIGVSKNGSDAQNIQAISGATVTSKAVTRGVNAALYAIANLDLEGGIINE